MSTIREVAKLSGVSVATVSRVFNGYADVRKETRQRVLANAQKLDYTPNAAARTLVKRRSQLIGVILFTGHEHPDLQHPFFLEVLVGLKHSLGDAGYDLLLFAHEQPGGRRRPPRLRSPCAAPRRRRRDRARRRRRRGAGAEEADRLRDTGRRRRPRGRRQARELRRLRQRRWRAARREPPARSRPPAHRRDRRARPHASRRPIVCSATAQSCRSSGSSCGPNTRSRATSTSRAASQRCASFLPYRSLRPPSSPPRT